MDSNFLIGLLIITGFFAIFGFVLWLCFRCEMKRKNAEFKKLAEIEKEQKERHKRNEEDRKRRRFELSKY